MYRILTIIGWAFASMLFSASGSVEAVTTQESSVPITCPQKDITLSMAGVPAAVGVVGAWQREFSTEHCPGFNVTFEINSWDAAAARVCASSLLDDPVDIAGMGGPFFNPQADSDNGWTFKCKQSKEPRETILLHLGYRGLTIAVNKNGVAAQCLQLIGGGLSEDQLRWMYSSFGTKELIANGWDPSSVPFSDEDDGSHLWSEIHENCSKTEILLAAEESLGNQEGRTGAIVFFTERVLNGHGEAMRDHFASQDPHEIDKYLDANRGGISFFHLFDMFDKEQQGRDILVVGIKDKNDNMYMPTFEYFYRAVYPLMRKFFIGLVNDPLALESTRPLLNFGFSATGSEILKKAGYWPIHESEKRVMYSLLGLELGLTMPDIEEHCGSSEAKLDVAGSETVMPVIQGWFSMFRLSCPLELKLEEGGSSAGASRICASADSGVAIDLGMMSRNFDAVSEAASRPKLDFVYDCVVDDGHEPRSVIQIDVALDGITIVFAIGSAGERCTNLLGGLTMDQLRWIYTSYSDSELEKSGWDPNCLSNNDFDSSTHLWSELDARCDNEEIRLSGDYRDDGSYTIFSERVLQDYSNGEHIADDRPKPYIEASGIDSLMTLLENDDAVSYMGFHYYFQHRDAFWAVPLAVDVATSFIIPSEKSIADGSYPLTRSLYVNVLNDAKVLQDAMALFSLGFSHPELLQATGFVPIVGDRMNDMVRRLTDGPYSSTYQSDYAEEDENSMGLIFGVIALVVLVSLLVGFVFLHGARRKRKDQFQR